MVKPVIYTIGHSTHKIEYFLELLKDHKVNCVVDVRSLAASRFNPQYNKKALANSLNEHDITYLHFGEEFGARQTDPNLLDEAGRVDFDKVRNAEKFKNGIERLWQGVTKGYVIALMCSESEPLDCHRFSMISMALKDFDVKHILKNNSVVNQTELENELLKMYSKKLPKSDLFQPRITTREQLKEAYRLKNREVAYSPSTPTRRFSK